MLVNNVQRYSNPGIESQVCLNFMPVSVVSSIKIVRNRDFPNVFHRTVWLSIVYRVYENVPDNKTEM